MKVTVVCVGKLKEKYWRDAIAEYSKRLSRYMKLEMIELADEKAPENMSDAQAALHMQPGKISVRNLFMLRWL